MKIGAIPLRAQPPEAAAPEVCMKPRRAGSFEAHFAEAQATRAKGDTSPAERSGQPDFANVTKAEYVARGKSAFAHGEITLDDLFQIRFADGDFDGRISSDTGKHKFVAVFEGLVEHEIEAFRASDPQAIIPADRHAPASMSRRGRGRGSKFSASEREP